MKWDFCAAFSKQVRKCDTLSRFDHRTFALLMPHASEAEAQRLCERLKLIFAEKCQAVDCMQLQLAVGIAEFVLETDESRSDLISRAAASLQHAVEFSPSVQ